MKFYLNLIIVILVSLTANAQVQSNCQTPPLLQKSYAKDIAAMGMERLVYLASADTALIEIPQAYTDTILQGLSAIANTGNVLEADSVFMMYCIHTYYSPFQVGTIRLSIDKTQPWTANWKTLNTTTGYNALDSFMNRYGFKIVYYSEYPSAAYAYLESDKAINTKIAIDSFKRFIGIYNGQKASSIGAGDHVSYKRDTASHFSFMMGWGDCPAGCTSAKIWYYTVTDDCKVYLDSTLQFAVDPWRRQTNCNLVPIGIEQLQDKTMDVSVFPNPVIDQLHFKIPGDKKYTYQLCDLTGKVLMNGLATPKLDLRPLPPGMYILKLFGQNGAKDLKRIVKQ